MAFLEFKKSIDLIVWAMRWLETDWFLKYLGVVGLEPLGDAAIIIKEAVEAIILVVHLIWFLNYYLVLLIS